MIVIGARGFAKELLDILISTKYNCDTSNLFFFDDLTYPREHSLYDRFSILHTFEQVENIFISGLNEFCLGLGNPIYRHKLSRKFISIGGRPISIISNKVIIGKFDVQIGLGSTIIGNTVISNSVEIGEGCLIYMNCSVTHDVKIGDFVQISPNVSIGGRSKIGNFTFVGLGATILPDILIGANCIIGAGSVVTKNIPDFSLVMGVPGKIVRSLKT